MHSHRQFLWYNLISFMHFFVLYTHYCVVLFYNIFPFWDISQLYKIYNFAQLCGWFIAGFGVQHQPINQNIILEDQFPQKHYFITKSISHLMHVFYNEIDKYCWCNAFLNSWLF